MNTLKNYRESLATRFPDVASEWHPTLNGALKPENIRPFSNKKVSWQCKKGHVWQDYVHIRVKPRKGKSECPECRKWGNKYPEIAKEWHPTKNGTLTPYDVTTNSEKSVYWQCPINSSHVYKCKVLRRIYSSRGCPSCKNEFNKELSLAVLNPSLASQWHPTLNGTLKPSEIIPTAQKYAWWLCTKNNLHAWRTHIYKRHVLKSGCPYCAKVKIHPSQIKEHNLAVLNPFLASQWHPTLNGTLKPSEIIPTATKYVWWLCTENKLHSWRAEIYKRHVIKSGCPYCAKVRTHPSQTIARIVPDLIEEWHPAKNGKTMPHNVAAHSGKRVWWICKNNPLHTWREKVYLRTAGKGCPHC